MQKKLSLITMLAVLSFITCQSQITHENTYTGAAEVASVENFGYKYYITDYLNNSVTIYNEDHTVWKSISLPVPLNQYLYDVSYVSSKVFNTDDLTELLMVTYQYISTSDTGGYYIYSTSVLNETGEILVSVPGGAYSFTFTGNNNKNKLVVYVYDYSVSTYIKSTEVYSLPDKASGIRTEPYAENVPYPNPAGKEINIPLSGWQVTDQGEIILTDITGKEYSRTKLKRNDNLIKLSTSTLPAGTYLYRIESNGRVLPAGTFIVK